MQKTIIFACTPYWYKFLSNKEQPEHSSFKLFTHKNNSNPYERFHIQHVWIFFFVHFSEKINPDLQCLFHKSSCKYSVKLFVKKKDFSPTIHLIKYFVKSIYNRFYCKNVIFTEFLHKNRAAYANNLETTIFFQDFRKINFSPFDQFEIVFTKNYFFISTHR